MRQWENPNSKFLALDKLVNEFDDKAQEPRILGELNAKSVQNPGFQTIYKKVKSHEDGPRLDGQTLMTKRFSEKQESQIDSLNRIDDTLGSGTLIMKSQVPESM